MSLLLLLVGCAPCAMPWAHEFDGIEIIGTPAQGTQEVLDAAPCTLRGRIIWVEEPFMCGVVLANGCMRMDDCGNAYIIVRRIEPATASALAHEIEHACQ